MEAICLMATILAIIHLFTPRSIVVPRKEVSGSEILAKRPKILHQPVAKDKQTIHDCVMCIRPDFSLFLKEPAKCFISYLHGCASLYYSSTGWSHETDLFWQYHPREAQYILLSYN